MKQTALGLALLVALTSCGGNDSLAGNQKAVEKAAQEQADYFSSGDYGGAWDMWTDKAKTTMSRSDYIKFGEACDLGGVPLDTEFVRFENKAKTEAVIKVGVGDFKSAYTMSLEDGDWSWVPSDEAQAQYKLGLDGAIAVAKEDGSCD